MGLIQTKFEEIACQLFNLQKQSFFDITGCYERPWGLNLTFRIVLIENRHRADYYSEAIRCLIFNSFSHQPIRILHFNLKILP